MEPAIELELTKLIIRPATATRNTQSVVNHLKEEKGVE